MVCSLSSIQSLFIYLTGVMVIVMETECTVPTLHTHVHVLSMIALDIAQVPPIKAHKYIEYMKVSYCNTF